MDEGGEGDKGEGEGDGEDEQGHTRNNRRTNCLHFSSRASTLTLSQYCSFVFLFLFLASFISLFLSVTML